jgi:hypothetical protein
MDDRGVIDHFLSGSGEGAGPSLHIENDVLMLGGWWHLAIRLGPKVFMVREEEPRVVSPAPAELLEVLHTRALHRVLEGHPLAQPIAYAHISVAGVEWAVWGPDRRTAEAALAEWAGRESVPRDLEPGDMGVIEEHGSDFEGARRIADLPPAVLLTVGLPTEQAGALRAALPEYRFEHRPLEPAALVACGELRPTVVVVNATERAGREFVMELRAEACGRFVPVAAVTFEDGPPAGADVALAADRSPGTWRADLLNYL